MNRLVAAVALVALLVGALGGYLWSSRQADSDLREAQSTADQLARETETLRAQLEKEASRRRAVEGDLRTATETNSRLHLLVSEGKK